MTATTGTGEHVDLSIDLDEELSCQAQGCDQPAAWRVTLTHCGAQGACVSTVGCDAHHEDTVRRLRDWERQGCGVACNRHSVLCHVTWRPL